MFLGEIDDLDNCIDRCFGWWITALMSNKSGAANLPGLRKSIRKTLTVNNRKKVNSESEASASPVLPVKRKQTYSLSEESGPQAKRMDAEKDILNALANLQATMGELKQKVDSIPNRDDFEKMDAGMRSIRKEVAVNTERLDGLVKQQDEDRNDFVRNVERVIDSRMAYHKTTRSGVLTPTPAEAEKESLFLLARRTMLLWPVDLAAETGNAARKFMVNVMEIPTAVANSLDIERADKLEQGRRSKIHDEVRVMFSSSRERDLIQSYAFNLGKSNGRAGIRMELLEHLKGLFKLFEAHGASLRQRFPGLKRAIKYDDAAQSICMDMRMPDKDCWHRIGEAEMREVARRHESVATFTTEDEELDRKKILSVGRGGQAADLPVVEEDSEKEDE